MITFRKGYKMEKEEKLELCQRQTEIYSRV